MSRVTWARDMSWWRFWWPSTNWSSGHRVRRRQIRQDPETERDDPCVLNSSHKLKSFQAHCKEFSRAFLALWNIWPIIWTDLPTSTISKLSSPALSVSLRRATHFIGDTAFIIPLELRRNITPHQIFCEVKIFSRYCLIFRRWQTAAHFDNA